jgi:hypothetical protein
VSGFHLTKSSAGKVADGKFRLILLKTYGRPVRKRFLQSDLSSLRQRIRPIGMTLAKMEIRTPRSS